MAASVFRAGLVLSLVVGAGLAYGETPAASPTVTSDAAAASSHSAPKPASSSAASSGAAAPVRRDPNGKTGISPAMEAIVRGDAAFLARDFPAAVTAYQEAIKLEPQKAPGHLRMAALHLAQGELDQASVVLDAAERFSGGEARFTVQTLALRAMLAERKGAWADANLAWSAYALLARAGTPALGDALASQAVATTASDRKTVIAATLERQAAYAKVRERIEKDLAKAEPSSASTSAAPVSTPAK